MSVCARLKRHIHHLRQETGSATVELAIVVPILLLLLVGTAELGRLFYTYTTLVKATKTGARFLSNSRQFTTTDHATAESMAKSLVVCGFESCTRTNGSAIAPLVPGLTVAHVNVTLTTVNEGTEIVRYVNVEIQDYPYERGIYSLSGVTGEADSVIYRALTPKTTLRYML